MKQKYTFSSLFSFIALSLMIAACGSDMDDRIQPGFYSVSESKLTSVPVPLVVMVEENVGIKSYIWKQFRYGDSVAIGLSNGGRALYKDGSRSSSVPGGRYESASSSGSEESISIEFTANPEGGIFIDVNDRKWPMRSITKAEFVRRIKEAAKERGYSIKAQSLAQLKETEDEAVCNAALGMGLSELFEVEFAETEK